MAAILGEALLLVISPGEAATLWFMLGMEEAVSFALFLGENVRMDGVIDSDGVLVGGIDVSKDSGGAIVGDSDVEAGFLVAAFEDVTIMDGTFDSVAGTMVVVLGASVF